MKTKLFSIALSALIAAGAALAAGTDKPAPRVEVTFIAPEKYSDVKDGWADTDRSRDQVLDQIKEYMQSTASKYLAEGQRLEIEVKDVDLAGSFEPWRGFDFEHIRILKDIYPPRMELAFRLIDASGKVVSSGQRHLQDLNYLLTAYQRSEDPLHYDKEMVGSWLRKEFSRAS